FQLQVREDPLAGGLTVSRRGRTLVMSSEGLVSSGGRLVSLGPPVRQGRTWLVPLDFVARGLPLVLEERAEYRRATRTLVVGEVSLPHVVVRSEMQAGTQRVTVDISPRTEHVVLQEPGRLILRFTAEALDAELGPHAANDLLSAVRLADAPPAVVLDLGPRFASFRASDVPVDASSTRVVIDILGAGGSAVTAGAGTQAATTPTPTDVPSLPVFEGPVTGVRTIVIDPGHGGDEQGARGPQGTLEKDVTLAVARQLRATIEARLGLRVLLTREGDQTVPLDARAALANNNKADLFVSLHANASVSPVPSGAEVFFLSLQEYGERAAADAVPDSVTVPAIGGVDRQVELILWEMAQARHLEDSAVLADLAERNLRARVPMSPRAIQQAPFRVLVGANMPAVLVEMGFLTNPGEEAKLTSPEHQSALVQALYDTVVGFRAYIEGGRRRPPTAPSAPGGGPAR
ncbi:MAG: N-acetylmuramoyl-L-alanine amidase, partial [Vicinamibacterales bacterium]|nr:N-acetylmuramoyl-L-alanine amidase [Vicinamibacterales bacterium]